MSAGASSLTLYVLAISVMCDISQLLITDRHADDIIKAARGLLSDERSPKSRKILTDLLLNLEDRSELESREEDQEWFTGTQEALLPWQSQSLVLKKNLVSGDFLIVILL